MIVYCWTLLELTKWYSRCSIMCKVGVGLYQLHCWQLMGLLFPYGKLLNLKFWTKKLSSNSEMTVEVYLRPQIQVSLDVWFWIWGEFLLTILGPYSTAEIWELSPNFMKYLQNMILVVLAQDDIYKSVYILCPFLVILKVVYHVCSF